MKKKYPIETLISTLELYKGVSRELQTICLQSYIQQFGPVPDEYGDKVRELMK